MTCRGIHGFVLSRRNMKSLTFKKFKTLVENQTKKRIEGLRTNNGGEFCGNKSEEFCKKCGIARHKTTPYLP
jgi:hypothetical protein